MRYAGGMKNLPALPTAGVILITAPGIIRRALATALTIQLALAGAVRVLDGGNHFDGLKLARELRHQGRDYHAALERAEVARAFTCYQMAALVEDTRPDSTPTLVTDLLGTFYDENIDLPEREQLLKQVLGRLERLGQRAPVFVSAEPEDEALFKALAARASQHWRFEAPQAATQPRLF